METVEGKKFKIIPISKTWMYKEGENRDAGILLSKAIKSISCQFNVNKRCYMTGLDEKEARQLEVQLLLPANTLSPYNDNYWGNFRNNVNIPKEGKILNLDNPIDVIAYKMCLVNTNVANTTSDINFPFAEFLLTSENEEAKSLNKRFMVKETAYKLLSEMTIEDKINFTKLWEGGKNRLTISHTPDMISAVVSKIVDTKASDFVELIQDPDYKIKLLLQDLIISNNIKISGNRYFITGEQEPFALHMSKALEYLQDPLNQSQVLELRGKIEINKKKNNQWQSLKCILNLNS